MDNQLFYIVSPALFEFSSDGMSLQQRRDRLGELIVSHGSQWAAIRMRAPDFMSAVEALGRFLEADEDFMNSAFENSPRQALPVGSTNSYSPLLGYYEPDRVRHFSAKLQAISATVIAEWENGPEGGEMGQVVHAFRSSFAEASRRGYSVAIEHR